MYVIYVTGTVLARLRAGSQADQDIEAKIQSMASVADKVGTEARLIAQDVNGILKLKTVKKGSPKYEKMMQRKKPKRKKESKQAAASLSSSVSSD